MTDTGPQKPAEKTPFQQLGGLTSLGSELVAAIVVFGAIGYGLDRWLDTEPWLVVGGLMFGLTAGLYRFMRQTSRLIEGKPDPHDDADRT